KVLDLGIAKVVDEQGGTWARLTGTYDKLFGTLCYVAPERIRRRRVTYAADIYAIGLLLYEMLTGRLPFDTTNEWGVIQGHCELIAAPLMTLRPLPPGIEEIVATALQKEPQLRFESAAQMG